MDGKKALELVAKQNQATIEELTNEKDFQQIYDKNLEILNSDERIAYPTIHGNYVYNFWKDKDHKRGIWRRSLLSDYTNGNPVWETLLDIDALSKQDDIKWVYKGSSGLYPSYNRFLIQLSKGGGDAVITKEFDVTKKEFIENVFFIDEAKSAANYVNKNTLIVATDFGEGSMITSGYPKQVKLWKHGTPIKDAQLIYEGETTDAFRSSGYVLRDGSQSYTMVRKSLTTFSGQRMVWNNNKIRHSR